MQISEPISNGKLKIEWLTPFTSPTIEALEKSSLASVRLRTAVGYRAAKNDGSICTLSDGKKLSDANIIVVGKIDAVTDKSRARRWIQHIKKGKSSGARVIVDYTDHHLANTGVTADFYSNALSMADMVICSSQKLKEHVQNYTDSAIEIIEDPIEVPIVPPKQGLPEKKTFLWFGHSTNIEPLIQCLLDNFDEGHEARVIVLTNLHPLPTQLAERLDVANLANIEINIIPWSTDSLMKAASLCDFCIIPSDLQNPRKNGASSNRLLTALALGLPTLATPLNSYKPFSDAFMVLEKNTVKAALQAFDIDTSPIARIQQTISSNYTKDHIAKDWIRLMNMRPLTLPTNTNRKLEGHRSKPVRLNLGCGDKIIDGYVNVDVVESRAGKKPDVLCDLHDLSIFDNDMADEILAVHVIEHFWQWEIVKILKEWARVLKPGGKMILECPNLISAAQEFLKDPDTAALGGTEGQRSMWVFYGDPGWRDPLMIHRWGYTPRSLGAVMHAAGLIDIQQEPAQYKLREPRDMRITGVKP